MKLTISQEIEHLASNLSAKRENANHHVANNKHLRPPGRGPKIGAFGQGKIDDRNGARAK